MKRFAASVHEGRTRLGLDQTEFGRLVGVGQQAVSRWERGASRPRRAVVVAVANVLGLSVDEMLAWLRRRCCQLRRRGVAACSPAHVTTPPGARLPRHTDSMHKARQSSSLGIRPVAAIEVLIHWSF